MDIKSDIFNNVKDFISEIDSNEQLSTFRLQSNMSAMSTQP